MKHFYTAYTGVTPDLLVTIERDVLPLARLWNYEAVKLLSFVVASAIEQGVELPPDLKLFLTDALRQIASGGSTSDSFFIKRKRGERDTSHSTDSAVRRVFKVMRIRQENPGISEEEAFNRVADEDCTSFHTVKAAWRDYRHCIEMFPSGDGAFFDINRVKSRE
jgi:hypothetical protein